jgi:cytochrome c peroxidase
MRNIRKFMVMLALVAGAAAARADDWTPAQLEQLRALWIGELPPPPPDPSNRYADDPRAAEFGRLLFYDRRLSSNGKVACASCHEPAKAFSDGRPVARGVGVTDRNAPTIIGSAWNAWYFWDGRKDSQWSQALASMENPLEMNLSLTKALRVLSRDADYRRRYRAVFGPLPASDDAEGATRAFVNIGKAIAAFERRVAPQPSRFDRYVQARLEGREPERPEEKLSLDEEMGLRAFLSVEQSQCLRCHNGPLFTNGTFHNIGSQNRNATSSEDGRAAGVRKAVADEFNCRGKWSDAAPGQCSELEFARVEGDDLKGAFKAPSLRNVARTGPYFHDGHVKTLDDVIWHYRTSQGAPLGQSELEAATMTGTEFDQLRIFLNTLDSPAPPGVGPPRRGG